MRNRVLGVIGVVWGAAVLIRHFSVPAEATGNEAYDAGRKGGLIFAGLLIAAGVFAFFKKPKQ